MLSNIFSINTEPDIKQYIFIMDDPNIEIQIDPNLESKKFVRVIYNFDCEIVFGFVFVIKESGEILPQASLNMDPSHTEIICKATSYSECMIKDFIENKKLIYNGCIYRLLELNN